MQHIKELWGQVNSSSAPAQAEVTNSTTGEDEDKLTQIDMAQGVAWGKQLNINFIKLTPEETRELTRLISKGSRNPLIRHPSKGRGKRK